MTRTEACQEQERLFPRGLWRKYLMSDTPDQSNQYRDISLNLCDIALDVRHACNGSADPWEPKELREVLAMLRARLDTWQPNIWRSRADEPLCRADVNMDAAVHDMVTAAIIMGEAWLAVNG